MATTVQSCRRCGEVGHNSRTCKKPAEPIEKPRPKLPPLIDWIPLVSPHYRRPGHLEAWCGKLELMGQRKGVRVLCAIPIRHFKTITAEHAIAWTLKQDPTFRWIYMTHGETYANTRGREIRNLCVRLGVDLLKGHGTLKEWRTKQGGGVFAMSASGSALGQDCDGLLVDDPIADPVEADKPAVRQTIDEKIAFYTARLSRGGSVAILMSRFHPDDPIGRRLRRSEEKWESLHARAIIDEGGPNERAFAPEVRTLEELRAIRRALYETDPQERVWWSQFQNEPRADAGDHFKAPVRYSALPTEPGWRDVLGVDLAYTTTRHSDWTALVLLRIWGKTAYVRKVERHRVDPALLEMKIRSLLQWNGGGAIPIFSYLARSEYAAIAHFARQGLNITPIPIVRDKLYRAQRTIAFWNKGQILLPHDASVDGFIGRAAAFRGIDGDSDDEIDALVSAVDGGMQTADGAVTALLGQRRI